jgi:hypothetical protein
LSAERETLAARRAALVARAAREREDVARQLAPIAALDRLLERIQLLKSHLPGIAAGAAFGLAALLIALPARFPVVNAGIAAFNLVGSLRKLFSRR